MRTLERTYRMVFLTTALLLSLIGLVFVQSAGSYWGEVHYQDSSPFIVKQGIYMIIALAVPMFWSKVR